MHAVGTHATPVLRRHLGLRPLEREVQIGLGADRAALGQHLVTLVPRGSGLVRARGRVRARARGRGRGRVRARARARVKVGVRVRVRVRV